MHQTEPMKGAQHILPSVITLSTLTKSVAMLTLSQQSDFPPDAATWRTRRNNVIFDSGSLALLCENMTSRKSEIHNVLHCGQRKTEPWPQITRTENFVKFGFVVLEI